MQKWCPEPLAPSPRKGCFEGLRPSDTAAPAVAAFRPERGFAAADTLLRSLSRDERVQLLALVEQDLRKEYAERHRQDLAALAAAAAASEAAAAEAMAAWQQTLATELRDAQQILFASLARRLSELAVLIAGKIVRREVALDPQVLVRALETAFYKLDTGARLSVTVHPDDAAWVEAAPHLREQLRIAEIKTDRRLARGGCLVKTDDVEWDATVAGQLAVLQDMLEEVLAVPAATDDKDEHA